MSVYIKGFPLPKNCGACPLRFVWCRERIYMVTRPERCPLVPVPPHGRLIDADALCKTLRSLAENEYTPEVFANWIENHIDTIIPAEEGER